MINQGPIEVLNRIKTESMEAFEFMTPEIILVDEDNEVKTDFFRFESHLSGEVYVVVAFEDEFFVCEDASYLFDLDYIKAECNRQWQEGNVGDLSEDYLNFLQELESQSEYEVVAF